MHLPISVHELASATQSRHSSRRIGYRKAAAGALVQCGTRPSSHDLSKHAVQRHWQLSIDQRVLL
jgi:hypothetical protein